jgi:hypothetical protein
VSAQDKPTGKSNLITITNEKGQHIRVPKTLAQRSIQHCTVEQIVNVPVPAVKEDLIHVRNHDGNVSRQLEDIVDVHVLQQREEIAHAPEVIHQEYSLGHPVHAPTIADEPTGSVVGDGNCSLEANDEINEHGKLGGRE